MRLDRDDDRRTSRAPIKRKQRLGQFVRGLLHTNAHEAGVSHLALPHILVPMRRRGLPRTRFREAHVLLHVLGGALCVARWLARTAATIMISRTADNFGPSPTPGSIWVASTTDVRELCGTSRPHRR